MSCPGLLPFQHSEVKTRAASLNRPCIHSISPEGLPCTETIRGNGGFEVPEAAMRGGLSPFLARAESFTQFAWSPLWVISGHRSRSAQCPLYPQKRTFGSAAGMSALCQKQTHALQQTAAYSITSSASVSRFGGILRSSALAVARLITRSSLVASSTGILAAVSPLRIRPA
jgi:hypothetical protein